MSTTIHELNEGLSDVFDKLVSGKIEPKVAKEIHNNAGKRLASYRLILDTADLTRTVPDFNGFIKLGAPLKPSVNGKAPKTKKR
jgi:hypothetical protein